MSTCACGHSGRMHATERGLCTRCPCGQFVRRLSVELKAVSRKMEEQ